VLFLVTAGGRRGPVTLGEEGVDLEAGRGGDRWMTMMNMIRAFDWRRVRIFVPAIPPPPPQQQQVSGAAGRLISGMAIVCVRTSIDLVVASFPPIRD
jgi:hypothetical protein